MNAAVFPSPVRSPYRVTGPTCLSFSGGRTSAYMLRQVLDHNDDLSDLIVCFANTGKEHEATLEFVRECGERWGVDIVWLEYRDNEQGFERVTFETASRNGEPFEAIIRKRGYLPNPLTRYCTSELKIRTMHRYLRTLGWGDTEDGWDQFIGLRADEHRRVSKIRKRGTSTETVKETMCMPLADAGVTVRDITAFWMRQPFDLGIPTYNGRTMLGNCDLCFLKASGQVFSIVASEPARGEWWSGMEALIASTGATTSDGDRFRIDRPTYGQMLDYAKAQGSFYGHDDDGVECFCGD